LNAETIQYKPNRSHNALIHSRWDEKSMSAPPRSQA
jgi:hypothetical protein